MPRYKNSALVLAMAGSLVFGAAGSCAAAHDSTQVSKPMQTNEVDDAKAVTIDQGTVGMIGGTSVGVISVSNQPLSVDVSLDVYPTGIPAEFTMQLGKRDLMPAADGMHRVENILPATGSQHGRVAISADPSGHSLAPGHVMVYLTHDGYLRLNGPETEGASDMQITSWGKDPLAPSVDVQWRPSRYAPEDTDPGTIKRAHLTIGKHVTVGRVSLTVSAIEQKADDHPAWVRFEISRTH